MWKKYGLFYCPICNEKLMHFFRVVLNYEFYKCAKCSNVQKFAVK